MPLPPGTILQLMYLEQRLQNQQPGRFIEIGPGRGDITACLLSRGWEGTSVDLEPTTVAALELRFAQEVADGRFQALCGNFLEQNDLHADLVVSCMVMEHFDDDGVDRFWRKAAEILPEDGLMVTFVPASQAHWGIEDEIAGHYRRYDRTQVLKLAERNEYHVIHTASLTWPLSNWLLPLSNFLVRREEARNLDLSMDQRTRLSGKREVTLKTRFPDIFGLILNRVTMYPFYLLQLLGLAKDNALVLYFEARPAATIGRRAHGPEQTTVSPV